MHPLPPPRTLSVWPAGHPAHTTIDRTARAARRPTTPAAAHHGLPRVLDCLLGLCPRRPRGTTAPARSPDLATIPVPAASIELKDFSPPSGPAPQTRSIQATRLRAPAGDAMYRLLPAGFRERDELLAYSLPGVDGRKRYHEQQKPTAPAGLEMLNILTMDFSGQDFRTLGSRGELDTFVLARHGQPAARNYRDEDLRDFHNQPHAGRTELRLATGSLQPDGSMVFGKPCGNELVPAINASSSVGLRFLVRTADGQPQRHAVVVRCNGGPLYELTDPRQRVPRYRSAGSMLTAIKAWLHELGLPGETTQPFSLFYRAPRPASPEPAGPAATLARAGRF
ncbi:hypothetical protein GT347_12725 [Xylophilus rhododendri]|uniref:Uncharacterized protein n=1 Tax=Xylophilus rhododendri TaxID=2697032 RepID=A0A857J7N2_9BURK|nr:hypothetical protein [Xylophilus rhododendri]QHI98778.1 hypothetical protein GT347_12725 [Xylophilus rhododendri]